MGKKVEREYNGGQWTEARMRSFIISALRGASQRWGPKHAALKAARVSRGNYRCASCGTVGGKSLPPEAGKKRRRNNAVADHIDPVVPVTGFTTWDSFIERLFCEEDGYQVLCWACNKQKTGEENEERKRLRAKNTTS